MGMNADRKHLTELPERDLDILRMFAVLFVLGDHLMSVNGVRLPLITDWALGRLGVLLFFFHTSTVLMSSLERGGTSNGWVRRFYVRRALRIYPLAIATVLAVVLFTIPTNPRGSPAAHTFRIIAANLTLTQNLAGIPDVLGPLWSLPLEVQMYVVLPVAYLIARKGVRPALLLFAIAAIVGLAYPTARAHLPGIWRLNVLSFAPMFTFGVLFYAWLSAGHRMPQPRESRFTRGAKIICTYSYGIYLLHYVALWVAFVRMQNAPAVIQWGTFVALVVSLPYVAYRFIERPGIELGQRLVHRRSVTLAATQPAP